jgi:hypothetical protein
MRIRIGWLFLTMLLVFASIAGAAAPRIVVEEESFDFGTILQGDKVEKVFRFRNDGDAPLVVDRVKTSCGCTAALLSASTLAPGESGEVRTSFDSTRFSGSVQKTVAVYSNDPSRAIVQLLIKGSIRQELFVSPAFIELGTLNAGVEKILPVTISNQGPVPVALREVRCLAPDLVGELAAPAVAPGGSVILTLRVTPMAGRGILNGYVIVATDSKRAPELRIPVYGRVAAEPPPAAK